VVGINTAVSAEGQGIGFAIPAKMVRLVMPQLKRDGRVKRSWLGIFVEEVSPRLRKELKIPKHQGALVRDLVRGGPAQLAGLRRGDIILTIDGRDVMDASQLSWLAANIGVGKKVPAELRRGDQQLTLEITMGALPD
jgi:S1-C subfamily serine protease